MAVRKPGQSGRGPSGSELRGKVAMIHLYCLPNRFFFKSVYLQNARIPGDLSRSNQHCVTFISQLVICGYVNISKRKKIFPVDPQISWHPVIMSFWKRLELCILQRVINYNYSMHNFYMQSCFNLSFAKLWYAFILCTLINYWHNSFYTVFVFLIFTSPIQ